MKRIFVCCVFLLFCVSVSAAEFRNWTGSNGKVIEAEFLSYDTEQEIVKIRLKNDKEQNVKIDLFSKGDQDFVRNGGKPGDNPFGEDGNETNLIMRLSLHADEFGEASIQIERTNQLLNGDNGEVPMRSSNLQHAKIFKDKNNLIRIIHDFAKPDPFEKWAFIPVPEGYGKNIDKVIKIDNNALSLVPMPFTFPNQKGVRQVSAFQYKSFFKLPLSLMFDIKSIDSSSLRLYLEKSPIKDDFGRIIVIIDGLNENSSSLNVRAFFASENDKTEDLFVEENIKLDKPWKKSFRFPGPNMKINNRFSFLINYGFEKNLERNTKPLVITRMEFLAKFFPMIGLVFNEKDSIVFAKSLVEGRPAKKAGLQEGDVIKSINGREIKKMMDAVNIIGETAIGDEISIKIERRGEMLEIKVKTDL